MIVINSKKIYVLVFIFFSIIILYYLFLGFNQGLNIYDEGLVLYGAERINEGDLPYKDFWTIYAPGQYYLLALIFNIFGTSVQTGRIVNVITIFALCITMYFIIKKLHGKWLAAGIYFITGIWVGGFGKYPAPVLTAITLGLIGSYFFISFLKNPVKKLLFISGIFTGITICFRHDIGFYFFLAQLLTLIIFIGLFLDNEHTKSLFEKLLTILKRSIPFYSGLFISFFPFSLYFVLKVDFYKLYNNLIIFPLTVFPEVRRLDYPSLIGPRDQGLAVAIKNIILNLPYYIPLLIFSLFILITGWCFWHIQSSTINENKDNKIINTKNKIVQTLKNTGKSDRFVLYSIIYFVLLNIFMYNQVRVRSDFYHLVPVIIVALPLLVGLSDILKVIETNFVSDIKNKVQYLLIRVCHVLLFLMFISIIILPLYRNFIEPGFLKSPENTHSFSLDRAQAIETYNHMHFLELTVKYIQENTQPEEKIYVGVDQHNKVFINNVLFYFLAERGSGTTYHELHPGVADTEKVQHQIIDELEKNEVRYIVKQNYPDSTEPNLSSKNSRVYTLDNHIRKNYVHTQTFGSYEIWKK